MAGAESRAAGPATQPQILLLLGECVTMSLTEFWEARERLVMPCTAGSTSAAGSRHSHMLGPATPPECGQQNRKYRKRRVDAPSTRCVPRKWARLGVLLPRDGKGCQAGSLPLTSLFPPLLSISGWFPGNQLGFQRLWKTRVCPESHCALAPGAHNATPTPAPSSKDETGQRSGPGTPHTRG